MQLQNVPLFGVGNEGKSSVVSAQKRTNLFVELHDDPEANGLSLYSTPGLTTFVNLGALPSRGAWVKDSTMYQVVGNKLYQITANGTTTVLGTLATSAGRVDLCDNGLQMLIVDGTAAGYLLTFAGSVFAGVVLPAAFETCTFFNGRFVGQEVSAARFWLSAAYDGATWGLLDFATAESDPDNLVRVLADSGILCLFGVRTTEFWGDSGATDFPLARIGAAAIEWGLAARWSLCKFDGSLIFLRRNRLGGVQVCTLVGNQAIPVSNPEVEYVFSTYTAVENATAYSYMVSGHPMYQINFPTPGESWLYDGQSKSWSRAVYGASGRHRGEIQVNFLNKPYVTDYDNGKVYLLDQTAYTDDGNYILRELITRHNKSGKWVRIPQLWLEMEAGVGLNAGQGSDPKVTLEISRDGGKTWTQPQMASIGKIGQYRVRALWTKLGRSKDWLFRFRITDPIKTVMAAAWAKVG